MSFEVADIEQNLTCAVMDQYGTANRIAAQLAPVCTRESLVEGVSVDFGPDRVAMETAVSVLGLNDALHASGDGARLVDAKVQWQSTVLYVDRGLCDGLASLDVMDALDALQVAHLQSGVLTTPFNQQQIVAPWTNLCISSMLLAGDAASQEEIDQGADKAAPLVTLHEARGFFPEFIGDVNGGERFVHLLKDSELQPNPWHTAVAQMVRRVSADHVRVPLPETRYSLAIGMKAVRLAGIYPITPNAYYYSVGGFDRARTRSNI